jgi:hypothetical protein
VKHSLIDQWAGEQGLQLDTMGGRQPVALTVDSVRVHLRELPEGNILAHARVIDIPRDPSGRDNALSRALSVATGRMRSSPAVLAADADGASLWLQMTVAGDSSAHDLGQAVEHLVNEVENWRGWL